VQVITIGYISVF